MLTRITKSRAISRCFASTGPSISYFSGEGSRPLVYKTISQQLRETTEQYKANWAVFSEHEGKRLRYAELLEEVEHMAAGLLALGLQRQARVGVFAPTMIDYYVIQLACSMADLILVNLNPAYRPYELEYSLNKVACEALFIVTTLKTSNYEKMVHDILPELATSTPGNINSKTIPSLKYVINMENKAGKGILNIRDVYNLGRAQSNLAAMRSVEKHVQAEDITNIQFTSGTTGSPKATCLTHFNILNNGAILSERCKYTSRDKILTSVPLYHCFGMVIANMAALSNGCELLYPHPVFDAAASLKVAHEKRATSLYGVPTMFIEFINRVEKDPSRYDLSSVRTGVMAGSICPKSLMEKSIKYLNCRELTICYGMTETSPVSFQTSPTDSFEKQVSTVGRLLPHTECKIVDTDGRVVPLGEKGEVCTRGYLVMKGYWNDEAATRASIDAEGWMHSGDVGIFDSEGFLSIVGRIKDMIARGGEKVFPKELEEYLLHHPKVFNVQVFGYPDERLGEEIFCWIKVKENQAMTKEEVLAYCKDKISHYKVPKYVKFVDEFPITVTGKPQKFRMTQAMIDELKANPQNVDLYKIR